MENNKSAKGVLIGLNQKFSKEKGKGKVYSADELSVLISEKLSEVNKSEKSAKVQLNSWKGKSGMNIIEKPDYFICETYQKEDPNSKPKKQQKEIGKDEVNDVIKTINKLNSKNRRDNYWSEKKQDYLFPTSDIAEEYFGCSWNEVFSTRKKHHRLNYILRILDYLGKIDYEKSGHTIIKNFNKDIQLMLENKKV